MLVFQMSLSTPYATCIIKFYPYLNSGFILDVGILLFYPYLCDVTWLWLRNQAFVYWDLPGETEMNHDILGFARYRGVSRRTIMFGALVLLNTQSFMLPTDFLHGVSVYSLATGWTTGAWFPAGTRIFSPPPCLGPTKTRIPWVFLPVALSLEIKRQGREADHSVHLVSS
jgi:hypothetical protein